MSFEETAALPRSARERLIARTHVALLRAVNVGGRNVLPMKDLTALCEQAGCRDVVTYIQSGNVAFRATAAVAQRLPAALARAIRAKAGFAVPVIVRDGAALAAVVKANPFLKAAGADPAALDMLHVGFLAAAPEAARVAGLDARRSPPDEFVVRGAEVYFRFPGGMGRSKLTAAYFDSKLATTITVRNWRTVGKLLELLRPP
jgi:uncharacterized protein (DUF1697 family)